MGRVSIAARVLPRRRRGGLDEWMNGWLDTRTGIRAIGVALLLYHPLYVRRLLCPSPEDRRCRLARPRPPRRLCGRASRRLQPRHASGAVCTSPRGTGRCKPPCHSPQRLEGGKPRLLFLSSLAEPSPSSGQGEGLGQRQTETLPDRTPLAGGGTVRGTAAAAAEQVRHDAYGPSSPASCGSGERSQPLSRRRRGAEYSSRSQAPAWERAISQAPAPGQARGGTSAPEQELRTEKRGRRFARFASARKGDWVSNRRRGRGRGRERLRGERGRLLREGWRARTQVLGWAGFGLQDLAKGA